MKRILLLSLVLLGLSCAADEYAGLPGYYIPYLDQKADEIAGLRKTEADGFFFWTDTHFPDNAGNAAAILNFFQEKLGPCKLFHGGDVALNAETLAPGIEANTASWKLAGRHGMLFPVRGNHDYTSSTSKQHENRQTMTAAQVTEYISSFLSSEAVKGPAETANYYYVDSRKGKVRYVVFDSTDTVDGIKIVYGLSPQQMDWIFNEAVAGLPDGWSLFFLSHVPFAPDHNDCVSLLEAGEKISALGDKAIMALCGHRHADMESGIGQVFQVLTAGDCLVDTGRTNVPYSLPLGRKAEGTVNEQTIDYVSISANHDRVTMKRIGYGYDRVFNIRPVQAYVGQPVVLNPSSDGPVRWFVYDAVGSSTTAWSPDRFRDYVTSHKNASITSDGSVTVISPGCSIAVATYSDGTKEFFMISGK